MELPAPYGLGQQRGEDHFTFYLTVFYLLRALNVERLIGLLRAGNLAVTVLSSLILVSQGLSLTNYPLTALGLLAFFLAITLFFHPTRGGSR